jgi:hypothetical protein
MNTMNDMVIKRIGVMNKIDIAVLKMAEQLGDPTGTESMDTADYIAGEFQISLDEVLEILAKREIA